MSSPSSAAAASSRPAYAHRGSIPSTPTPKPRISPVAGRKLSGSSSTLIEREQGKFFSAGDPGPPGGLVTPPASGGTLPMGADRRKDLFGGAAARQRSPSLGPTARGSQQPRSGAMGSAAGGTTAAGVTASSRPLSNAAQAGSVGGSGGSGGGARTSYADFWSKMGASSSNGAGASSASTGRR